MNDFVLELARNLGDFETAIRVIQRTRIDRVKITPTPDGVEVGFRATLAPRVDIAIHKVITGNYQQDIAIEGSFAALRFSRPTSGNTHFQRIEDGGLFTFEQGTEYWLDLACPDIDRWGVVHGILHYRRRFVTSRRSLLIQVNEIIVDGDSDKLGPGEIFFYYRYFNMIRGGFFAEYQTVEMSISSGESVTRPFNPNFYEPVHNNMPKAIGLYYYGKDDDGPYFGPMGLELNPGWPDQMPEKVHGHYTGYNSDIAFATDRIALRSAPGEDNWTAELATHPEGRLRFRVRVRLHCKVEALPQPVHVNDWIVDAVKGPKLTQSWNGPSPRAQVDFAHVMTDHQSAHLQLGCNGACHVTVSDNGQLKDRWTGPDRIAALLPLPAPGKETSMLVHAIDTEGRLRIAKGINAEKRAIDWADVGITLTNRPPVALQGRDDWAWLAEGADGSAVLLSSDGQMRQMQFTGKGFPDTVWGCPHEGDWLVWGQTEPDGPWQGTEHTAKALGSAELPAELGAPFLALPGEAGGLLIYGLDKDRMLRVWDVNQSKVHDLGLIDEVCESVARKTFPTEASQL